MGLHLSSAGPSTSSLQNDAMSDCEIVAISDPKQQQSVEITTSGGAAAQTSVPATPPGKVSVATGGIITKGAVLNLIRNINSARSYLEQFEERSEKQKQSH